jgi:hypothetical protein
MGVNESHVHSTNVAMAGQISMSGVVAEEVGTISLSIAAH